MKSHDFTPPELSLQDNLRHIKMQQAQEYALAIIEANRECFVAHWIMQNTDKNLDNYTLCYCYQGEAIKFWMGEKTN